ncbi:MAG: 6-carboxytetrahydropterin synthase [Silvanigrellaceae bacterium]
MFSSNNTSKIFVRNVTVLDCAVWTLNKGPVGRSWSVDVEWSGQTDFEGVVIDFSNAKKLAKKVIDDEFDHRLIISSKSVSKRSNGRILCLPALHSQHEDRFLLETYSDSLAILDQNILEELTRDSLGLLEAEIANAILKKSPENVSNVKIRLTPHAQMTSPRYFNYLHSLRLHSGNCQRFHGHSNIIEVFKNDSLDENASIDAANLLNGKYLIADCYFKTPEDSVLLSEIDAILNGFEMNSDQYTWLSYEGTQGVVNVRAPRSRIITMPSESTIENIASWLFQSHFNASAEMRVEAYEGHHKGAIFP